MWSDNEQIELLCEWQLQIVGISRVCFPHHVNHLNPVQDHTSAVQRASRRTARPYPFVYGVLDLQLACSERVR
jgi:hypothetical protein